jgi:hypothetical protein
LFQSFEFLVQGLFLGQVGEGIFEIFFEVCPMAASPPGDSVFQFLELLVLSGVNLSAINEGEGKGNSRCLIGHERVVVVEEWVSFEGNKKIVAVFSATIKDFQCLSVKASSSMSSGTFPSLGLSSIPTLASSSCNINTSHSFK